MSILGVNELATEVECKQAYFRMAKKCHPDVTKNHSLEFIELKNAYETLQHHFRNTGQKQPISCEESDEEDGDFEREKEEWFNS